MNALSTFIQQQMDARGMTPAGLSRASGISEATLHKLLRKNPGLPEPQTVAGLARAFPPLSETDILLHAARAKGYGVEPTVPPPPAQLADEALLHEIGRRLRDCAPVIAPLDLAAMHEIVVPQVAELLEELQSAVAVSTDAGLEYRARIQRHLIDYLKELMARRVATLATNVEPEPDPAQSSDQTGHA